MALFTYVCGWLWTPQFLLIFGITLFIWKHLQRRHYNLPPCPYSYPLIGNVISVFRNKDNLYKWCGKVAKEHGPVFRLSFGVGDAVVLNDIASVQAAMTDAGMDFSGRPHSYVFSILTEDSDIILSDATNPTWKARRKLLATAVKYFTVGRAYEQRVDEAVQVLLKHLDEYAQEAKEFDPENYCKLFTYNLIANMCFQKRYEFDDPEFIALHEVFQEVTDDVFNSVITISDIVPFVEYLPFEFSDVKITRKTREKIVKQIEHGIALSKEKASESSEIEDLTAYVMKVKQDSQNDKEDALHEMTEKEFVHLLLDIFGAGVDTTRATLQWLLAFLAINQDVQDKVYQEIIDIVGDDAEDGQMISSIDYRHRMPYSDAVVLETTRAGIVAPFGVPHRAICDSKIGQYDIPKNTMVFINHWAINNEEKEMKDPKKFSPERFLTQEGKLSSRPKSYLPFGMGRRACPGETTARNTVWIFLVTLVNRYKILPPKGEKLVAEDRCKIADGAPKPYKIILEKRH